LPRSGKIISNLISSILSATLLILLTGCSLTQIVPIQVGRISQSDTYLQTFSFFDDQKYADINLDSDKEVQLRFSQTRQMDNVFSQMLGEKNWQNLKDLYGSDNLLKELLAKKIYIKGTSSMQIYPDPFDERYFTVDGTGRYFLIREETEAILLTGDYSFSDQQYSVADLERGYVVLNLELFLIKIPGLVTYYHEAPLKYKIYLDNSLGKQRVYSIDYSRKHEAFLVKEGEKLDESKPFAAITFAAPSRPTKLWDFRGIQFMRRDYEQLLNKNLDR